MSYGSSDQEFLLILDIYDRSITCYFFAKLNCNIVRYKNYMYHSVHVLWYEQTHLSLTRCGLLILRVFFCYN